MKNETHVFATERKLTANRLAQYITRNRCERYLKLCLFPSESARLNKRYESTFEVLSPLLSRAGQSFEREKVAELSSVERVIDLQNRPPADFISALKSQAPGRAFYDQPSLEGKIGKASCEGRADLIAITRLPDSTVEAVVIDIKASRRETVGFRLQVAFYASLLGAALKEAGLRVRSLEGAVASRESDFDIDRLKRFDLALYLDEIERLVAAEDSDVARAAGITLDEARYNLGPHCDGCPYNSLCFIESAEREDLSIVPLITATEKSALQSCGVQSARDLAALMVYGKRAMEPAPGRESDVESISSRWPLATRLPVLVERARAALNRQDSRIEARRHLLGADYGSLPDNGQYPDLVKVFIDAHKDYIEDRLYLIAGLVTGPRGSSEVVEMTPSRPDTGAERDMLVSWMQRMLPAIARAADSDSAPVHIYLFDRGGEHDLLDGLARHFDALCAIPAFYDLLTSSPALTQAMVSFLAEEVRSRLSLARICQNLYEVASELGFKWAEELLDLRSIFRARIFDNRGRFRRDSQTGRLMKADRDGAGAFWIESAARFGAKIPLEYAYAAWGLLEVSTAAGEAARGSLRGFREVKPDHILALAAHRCRALRHIEERFKYKNRQVEKQPLDLKNLDRVEADPAQTPLYRLLEDFLFLEHHATLQERLLHLSLAPELRAQTGRTAILICDEYEKLDGGVERAIFSFAGASGIAKALADMSLLRFREGDWVVLNPLTGEDGVRLSAWKLVHGRLAVIEEVDDARIGLRLLSMNFKNSSFRYGHRAFAPERGSLFTIDEMADDLNADKFLEACRHASQNRLYRWLDRREEGKEPRSIRPSRLREARAFADLAAETQAPHGLTPAQRRIVGEHLTDRVLVVQGPPGTGKSHTLGFAVLARALALATPARPFRVAVAAKTHAATLVALESIAGRARELAVARPEDSKLNLIARMKVVKISSDPAEPVPGPIGRIAVEGTAELSAAEQWEMLLAEPFLVMGGTPGGLYKIVKQGAAKGRAIDWSQDYFDLVVVDEASQMGIAEALTAAAFLREDGQFIAIGDHRQMPPILAHAWDQESRRELKHSRPHLSIFEYARALGFAGAALDQSFRIPAEIADFLNRHIYAEDGIDFRSDNRRRLDHKLGLEGWLAAALAAEHPLVVIEHDEAGSQRENRFEARLIEEIARVAVSGLGLDSQTGLGIVVPHRAQKAMLRRRLPELADSIDTVERFQGGQRELVIVSATVSDRDFAGLESGFLLEPRRLTVAVSRPRRKLIVISSRTIFDIIPGDLDEYERGALWKYLRHECYGRVLWEGVLDGHRVWVRAIGS